MYVKILVRQIYHLYYEALDTNRDAFTHGLFAQAHQELLTALHCALSLGSARKLSQVERRALEQLDQLKERFATILSPLEPDEVINCRALIQMAATYRSLAENAFHGDAHVAETFCMDGHRFEDTTIIDAKTGAVVPLYVIDGTPVEPSTWDVKYTTAQDHENAPLRLREHPSRPTNTSLNE